MKTVIGRFTAQMFLVGFITLTLLKIVDWLIPSFIGQKTLFPPNQTVRYKTIDFNVVASINEFGFRGKEAELRKGQIIVVGDSYTFGWGVSDDNVWPRLLENRLRSTGIVKAVYNFGVPGTDTEFHIDVANTYVERLKPSILVLSVLIADDLQQVAESKTSTVSVAKRRLRTWFPGWYQFYLSRRNSGRSESTLEVAADWAKKSKAIIQDNRLEISKELMPVIEAGNINPGLFALASRYPDRATSFWDQLAVKGSKEETTFRELTRKIGQLSHMVHKYGGRLIIFSMPSGDFVRSSASKNYSMYGFRNSQDSFSTLEPEAALESMAEETGSEFAPSLQRFRSSGEDYFFAYDGHPNPEGHELIANILFEHLRRDSKMTSSLGQTRLSPYRGSAPFFL